MGIKPSYIKSMGIALLEQHGKSFNGNFDDNKKVVTEITTIESKMIRNRVAGYVTRNVNRAPARRYFIRPNIFFLRLFALSAYVVVCAFSTHPSRIYYIYFSQKRRERVELRRAGAYSEMICVHSWNTAP